MVSYIRQWETSAGCLKSIDPTLGIRQLFVTSHKASDVTFNAPNQMTYLSNRFNRDFVHIETQDK